MTMRTRAALTLVLVMMAAFALSHHEHDQPPLITHEHIRAAEHPNGPLLLTTLTMMDGATVPIWLHVTTKGNGAIELGSHMIRVYDAHDDGLLYEPFLLEVKPIMVGERVRGLRFVGTQIRTWEHADQVVPWLPIDFIGEYDPATRDFVIVNGYERLMWGVAPE